MNQRQQEIREIETQQNRMIYDRIAERTRIFNGLKAAYEQISKEQEKRDKRKTVSIDTIPEALRDNPLFLLRAGFAALDSDEKTEKTVIKPESGAAEATEKETEKTTEASHVEVVEVSAHE